ncbi:MAG: hypothetical protein KAR31_07585, partial [Candidatus Omnitrophica bacterium]|nr:hypothetical protein [Candidatus Omnitrophota bacterium]
SKKAKELGIDKVSQLTVEPSGRLNVLGEHITVGVCYAGREAFVLTDRAGMQEITLVETRREPEEKIKIIRESGVIKKLEFYSQEGEQAGEVPYISLRWEDGRMVSYSSLYNYYFISREIKINKFSCKLEGLNVSELGWVNFGLDNFWIPQARGWAADIKYDNGEAVKLYLTNSDSGEILEQDAEEVKVERDEEWTAEKQAMFNRKKHIVFKIAYKYCDYAAMYGINFHELISEGNNALKEAIVSNYLPGEISSKYATFYITRGILRPINNQKREKNISAQDRRRIGQLYKTMRELEKKLNRKPDAPEICDAMDISIEELFEVQQMWGSLINHSMDSPTGRNERKDETRHEEIADKGMSAEEKMEVLEREAAIRDAMSRLTEEERKYARMLFGFDGNTYSPEEIAGLEGITLDEFNAIKNRIFAKMAKYLNEYSPHGPRPKGQVVKKGTVAVSSDPASSPVEGEERKLEYAVYQGRQSPIQALKKIVSELSREDNRLRYRASQFLGSICCSENNEPAILALEELGRK